MKILFVTLFLPQEKAYHAGSRYVFEVIRNLSKKHEIHLTTRLEEKELPLLESLRPFCKEIHPYPYASKEKRNLFDSLALILNYIGFSRFADRISRRGSFDLVQVEWVEAGLMMKKRETPMILDAHDVITKPAERSMKNSSGAAWLFLFVRYTLVKALEKRTVRKFDVILSLSEYDRKYLLGIEPGLKVKIVPIPAGLDMTSESFDREENTILFLASYKYRKVNVDAALYFYHSVFPLIKQVIPAAKFIIAGYGPPEELTSLQDRDPSVSVPGFVDNLDRCYKAASVFVAPILVGGGIIVKILDAMAAATPVVTTTYGNEGIGAVPGRDLLIGDDPSSFAASVVKLLRDPASAQEIGRNGQAFAKKNFSLDAVMAGIESAYRDIVKQEATKRGAI